jgi:hypothetical protein
MGFIINRTPFTPKRVDSDEDSRRNSIFRSRTYENEGHSFVIQMPDDTISKFLKLIDSKNYVVIQEFLKENKHKI